MLSRTSASTPGSTFPLTQVPQSLQLFHATCKFFAKGELGTKKRIFEDRQVWQLIPLMLCSTHQDFSLQATTRDWVEGVTEVALDSGSFNFENSLLNQNWSLQSSLLALYQKKSPCILTQLKMHIRWPFMYSGNMHARVNRKQTVYFACRLLNYRK